MVQQGLQQLMMRRRAAFQGFLQSPALDARNVGLVVEELACGLARRST